MLTIHRDLLEIKTLGEFVVKRGPVILSEKAGRSTKLWELFKYLLTHRGNRLVAESVMETLWPDRDYENARTAFKVQIYRLKQLFGGCAAPDDLCITYSQGCYRLDAGDRCRIDTDTIEKNFDRAIDLAVNNPVAAMGIYRQVIELYRGDYLPEITATWVLPARNRFQRLFLKSIFELSNLYGDAGRHTEAVTICERALQAVPLAEELHLRYLQALLGAGKTKEAEAHYKYITSFYYLELGVKPSPELKQIYRQINPDHHRVEMDLKALQKMMGEQVIAAGAFYCRPESFRLFYQLEKRRQERENRPVFLGLLTITRPNYALPRTAVLDEAMAELKQAISTGLRKGDVYTQWNEAQILLLLPGKSLELGKKVLQRIETHIRATFARLNLTLRYTIQPLLDPSRLTSL